MTETEETVIDLLRELVAIVRGECPSLLSEDSGGSAELSMRIDAALSRAPEAQPADPASVLPVLAHLVATGQATDKQRAELLAALSPPSTGGPDQ